jgi:putative ABC transport system permease protein
VVTQFTASIILIIGMMIIFRQISFMHNKDLGFNDDQVLVVPIQTDKVADNFRDYKSIFMSNPNVLNISRAGWLPSDPPNQNMFEIEGRQDALPLWNMAIDYDFMETMEMKIVEGRGFNRELDNDSSNTYLINQAAVKNLNIENPIGTRIGQNFGQGGDYGTIVGVVEDFHIEGFDESIKPMIFNISNYTWFATIKIRPENMSETIAFLETKWNEIEPTHPFRYQFMDEKFAALYAQQVRFGKIFLYLTILAIIISCMGLYGLASFTAEQRTREIGIRKVMGASVPQLMRMLSIEFVRLVIVAIIIAIPISLILARNWLSGFTYQIDMPVLPFIYAAFMAVVIALLTVSYQAYQAAISDPVRAIKYE